MSRTSRLNGVNAVTTKCSQSGCRSDDKIDANVATTSCSLPPCTKQHFCPTACCRCRQGAQMQHDMAMRPELPHLFAHHPKPAPVLPKAIGHIHNLKSYYDGSPALDRRAGAVFYLREYPFCGTKRCRRVVGASRGDWARYGACMNISFSPISHLTP